MNEHLSPSLLVSVRDYCLRYIECKPVLFLQADDMYAATQHLQSIGKQTLGLMGHSKAGSGVLICSSKHSNIPRVANVSGRFDHKRGEFLLSLSIAHHPSTSVPTLACRLKTSNDCSNLSTMKLADWRHLHERGVYPNGLPL